MLWYKGWLETRFRLLFLVGLAVFFRTLQYRGIAPAKSMLAEVQGEWLFVALMAVMLSGAGIATQPAIQATKGLHGSTLFTLALPVSRLRLLAVRAGLGWLLVVGFIVARCTLLWLQFSAPQWTVVQHAFVLIACSTGVYAVPVLLATFLDEYWRGFAGAGMIVGLRYVFSGGFLPSSLNLMRAMGEDSPIMGHAIPWAAITLSLGLASAFFYAALKIVQRREY